MRGDKLQWQEAAGGVVPTNRPVEVLVTILKGQADEVSVEAKALRRVAALQKLAAMNALTGIQDPVQWQRELREDRELPGQATC